MKTASIIHAFCACALAAVAGWWAPVASAQSLEEARQKLQAGDRALVEEGIQGLGLLGTKEAVAPLVARIRQGLPDDLLDTAIVTLMALGQPDAAEVLFDLTSYRRPTIRVRAVEAIAAINPPGADRALIASLSDPDPKVRSAAAVGLGEIEASSALPVLFHALDKGNLDASEAIGKVAKPDDVDRLLGYLGKVPFRSMGPALRQFLTRSDIPDKPQLKVVARLAELATPDIKSYLGDLLATAADDLSPKLSRAIARSMQQIAE